MQTDKNRQTGRHTWSTFTAWAARFVHRNILQDVSPVSPRALHGSLFNLDVTSTGFLSCSIFSMVQLMSKLTLFNLMTAVLELQTIAVSTSTTGIQSTYNYSFYPGIISDWNRLPSQLPRSRPARNSGKASPACLSYSCAHIRQSAICAEF